FARFDHPAYAVASLTGPLNRCEQAKEHVASFAELLERAPERGVMRRSVLPEPSRVGGEEGERTMLVVFILREVEPHSSDRVPAPSERLEERFEIERSRLHAVRGVVRADPKHARRGFIAEAFRA